jgi:hypothetical protein
MKNKKSREESLEKQFIIDCIIEALKQSDDMELLRIIYMLLLKNRNESLYR